MVRCPVGGEDGQVGLPAEAIVERREQVSGRLIRIPGVLQPPSADLRIRPAVDASLGTERRAEALVVAQIAVVAEREPARRVVERLGVLEGERGEPRRPSKVDEGGGRLGRPDGLASGIVAEGPDIAIRPQTTVRTDPSSTPAEPGDPEPLQLLRERPQLVKTERCRSPGDEVLTHPAR